MSLDHDKEEGNENNEALNELDWLLKDSSGGSNELPSSPSPEIEPKSNDDYSDQEAKTFYSHSQSSTQDVTGIYEDNANLSDENETDDDDDGLNPEQRRLLQENTLRNDAEEGDDYDVQRRLELANKELESEGIKEEDRERRVNFKNKLVDLEVPPSESSSSSSSSEDEDESKAVSSKMNDLSLDSSDHSKNNDTIEIQGQFLKRDEKVLIERGGKFEFVEAAELEGMVPASYQDDFDNHVPKKTTLPPLQTRPKSAPVKHPKPPKAVSRPMSAYELSNNYPEKKSNGRPFSYSEETKRLIKQRAELKAKKNAEDEKRRKQEEEEARQEADDVWKSWVEKKNDEIRKKKKEEKEKLREQEKINRKVDNDNPEEAEEAFQDWLKQKQKQIRKERLMTQQQQIEYDEGWYLRERRDCNRAFRLWLRNKNEMSRRMKENENRLRKQSLKEMRRARKVQKLMASIREAQQMKYVEYYGYRI